MSYKFLAIPDLAKAGLNSDKLPWNLPASFLTEISNTRLIDGKLSPFGGHAVWATLPVDFMPGFLMEAAVDPVEFWLIAGRDAVWVYDGGTFSNISNVDGYTGVSNEDIWVGCKMGNISVINNPGHYPEYWFPVNTAQPMQYLPWDATKSWKDAGETCKIMRSHKQFLFALDLEGTTIGEVPDGVRWSSPSDVGSLPETWDPLDTTSTSGFARLGGEGGRIIDGLSMRDAFVVYRQNAITVFDYVGGQFVWQIRHLTSTVGSIAPDSIVEVKGRHYLIGDADILVNDGNTIESLIHGRIRKRFSSDIDPDNFLNSYAVKNNISNEVWFCIPRNDSIYPDIAYIYNWKDDTWSVRDIPAGPFASYGSQSSPQLTWDTIQGNWDTVAGSWSQTQASPLDDTVIQVTKPAGSGQSGELLLLDRTNNEETSLFDTNIERIGFALEGLGKVNTITRVYPHVRGPGRLFVQIGSQDYPGAPTRWKPAVLFSPETDRKVDVRTTGELHCFRFFSQDVSSYWELSGMDIEYVDAGAR